MRRLAFKALPLVALVTSVLALIITPVPQAINAASHREAPLIAFDPEADITDVFMFRSYEAGKADKVVMIMDVIPGQEPSSGPNYFLFDPNVLYTFSIDNNADGRADDLRFEIQFTTERVRGVIDTLNLFLAYVALPQITALDGAGSEGLGVRQRYTVTLVKKNGQRQVLGRNLIAVPSNVGPRTMPDYNALTAQGIHNLDGVAGRVYAGQRDDPFYIDLGAVFDTLNLRAPGTDMLSGFNVNTIALEVPATLLTKDGLGPNATTGPVLGMYGSTSRRATTVLRSGQTPATTGSWVQVQRLANPLVNEAIIGTEDKDRWNGTEPHAEAVFLDYYRNPRLATALSVVFGADVPSTPRDDLVNILLKYPSGNAPLSELLRLNLNQAPTPLANQQRLTILAGDNAGWPNGRRPIDDVIDVAVKVIGGANYAGAGDGVDANDVALPTVFPFLSTPWDGRNRQHDNP